MKYAETGDKKNAFRVLDQIIKIANEDIISASFDKLKKCYIKIDSTIGDRQFSEIMANRTLVKYSSPIKQGALVGKYKDVVRGNLVDFQSFHGKYVVIDFWTTWCSFCRAEIPELKEFAKQYSSRNDFIFLSINGDLITGGASENAVKEFIRKLNINYTTLIDKPQNSLTKHFGVNRWPSKFLLDKNLQILFSPADELTIQIINDYLNKRY